MNSDDFLKLIGVEAQADYVPVAGLLRSGYAFLGHFNSAVNEGFTDLCVVLNARLMELAGGSQRSRSAIRDFGEFLEEVVLRTTEADDGDGDLPRKPEFGSHVPIAAIPLSEMAVIYPVSQIGALLRRAKQKGEKATLPTFLDLSKSEILAVLRMKLW